jgi:hypothetical protein
MTGSTSPKRPLRPPRSTRKTSDSKFGSGQRKCGNDLVAGLPSVSYPATPFPNQCLNPSITVFPRTPSSRVVSPKLDTLGLPSPAQTHSWTLWIFTFLLSLSLAFKYSVLFAGVLGCRRTHTQQGPLLLPSVEVFYSKDVMSIIQHAGALRILL